MSGKWLCRGFWTMAVVWSVVSYARKVLGTNLVAELKWLHETTTERRPEGDFIWFKLLAKF